MENRKIENIFFLNPPPTLEMHIVLNMSIQEIQTKEQHIKENGKEIPQVPFKAHHNIKLVARPKRGLPQIPPPLGGFHEKV